MKKAIFVAIVVLFGLNAMAQFKTGTLQAAGLTCAMCTKAINETLKELRFVQSVKADIKNSQFVIQFKEGVNVDPDALKEAVEDAGFSVAKLKLALSFDNVQVNNDSHIKIGGKTYHFLDTNSQLLNGERTITFVDKNFVLAKEFKKYAAKTQMACVQTGKAESCCTKEGINENARIYHVTI
ncbi:MAG: heavy-metal-associated domain-containing protein [Chitinophagaceae bacterium]|nr:heavy-metal-associated domain-containing protein [Chitinophagaceae bacterium]